VSQAPEFRLFLEAERDAAELRAVARSVRETLSRAGARYRRLSDLLDECLPADKAAQDRIARAVSMPTTELDALRSSRVDPLTVSVYALMCLADAFGISESNLRRLIQSDHERFGLTGASARGGEESDPWAAFDTARVRLTAENPARFTTDED
jgi:hypothetical protein